HKNNVAHLHAVAIQCDGLAIQCTDQEMRYPSLVLRTELMWTVNAAHSEYARRPAERARVVQHILIGCALRAAVRSVEIEWARFVDSATPHAVLHWLITSAGVMQIDVGQIAVYFIGRGVDEWRGGVHFA